MADEDKTTLDEAQAGTDTQPVKAGDSAKMFTQDEVNELMGDRAKRAAKKAKADLLAELGLTSETDLKNVVKAKRDADEAQKTELQKAHDALSETQKKLAEQERRRVENVISSEVIYQASQLGFINPKEALKLVDLTLITVDEDDAVKGADVAVKALAESSAHLLRQAQRPPNPGATNPASGKQPGSGVDIKDVVKGKLGRAIDTSVFERRDGGLFGVPEE